MSSQNPQRPGRRSPSAQDSQPNIKVTGLQSPGASGVRPRTRTERVAAHFTYYGLFQQTLDALSNIEIRKQVLMVVAATMAMCIATRAWNPPFPFVEYDVPDRSIVSRVAFTFREENTQAHIQPMLVPEQQGGPEQTVKPQTSAHEPASATSALQALSVLPQSAMPNGNGETALPPTSVSPVVPLSTQETTDSDLLLDEAEPLSHEIGPAPTPPTEEKTLPIQSSESVAVPVRQWPVLLDDGRPGQLTLYENGEQIRDFASGVILVEAGQMLTRRDIRILQTEFAEIIAQRTFGEKISRFCGVFFLTLALFLLTFVFLQRRERRRPKSPIGMGFLYMLMVVTIVAAVLLHESFQSGANLELIPILLFAQGVAVAFSWELALVLTVIISFVFVMSQANSIFTMALLIGVAAAVVIHLGRLRSRTKLIVVGSFGSLVALLLTLFIEMIEGQEITQIILAYVALNAVWTCSSAFLMTGLLPFIERPCGILTDMSLLELGDPSHPLLHELTRHAPATYSHSLQVASIAETAAEAIGARGLLVRVGAYFHDIGKILNPSYFTENQVVGQNVHDHLEPRVSTLVIVAHVKDGADLVRQHRVPKPIIDLVEQHHGTSLVSFFHALATRQSREQGYNTPVDEGSFRYPGPKPQSKEAGVLMLADAAESACRSLKDSPPNKIEAMVRHISEDKLQDGQFDESGLTLRELRTIENSIINSILAMRHNRISYPDKNVRKSSDSSEGTQPQITPQ